MKAIDLTAQSPSLSELLRLADEENLILRTAEGREFVLAPVDDLQTEVAQVAQNKELMEFLAERSRDTKRSSWHDAKKRLAELLGEGAEE